MTARVVVVDSVPLRQLLVRGARDAVDGAAAAPSEHGDGAVGAAPVATGAKDLILGEVRGERRAAAGEAPARKLGDPPLG